MIIDQINFAESLFRFSYLEVFFGHGQKCFCNTNKNIIPIDKTFRPKVPISFGRDIFLPSDQINFAESLCRFSYMEIFFSHGQKCFCNTNKNIIPIDKTFHPKVPISFGRNIFLPSDQINFAESLCRFSYMEIFFGHGQK